MTLPVRHLVFAAISFVAVAPAACSSLDARSDTVDPATLARDVRADYEVFAQRCSKCHGLSRPLSSGIVDDDHWAMYVARMRRQPASGISAEDARVILRFLHYYSLEQIHKKEAHAVIPPTPE
jgi:mono/diheme cytochrome c family protein